MGTLTTNFSLYKPAVGETGWGDLRNASYDTIDTQLQLGTVHRASDGSDHTFIDQSVISGAAPVLDGTNFTNIAATAANVSLVDAGGFLTATDVEAAFQEIIPEIDANTAHVIADGSSHTFIDQNVTSGASPVFDGNNFTGMDANDVDIADAGAIITATEVEGALQENRAAIDLNTAKVTNVSTTLSTGTVNATTYGITSDGGADDVVLVEADTTNAGILGSDKWDEIVASTTHISSTGSDHSLVNSSLVSSINFVIDGGGAAITTGVKGYIEVPFACTINQVTLLADVSTTTTIDIWKDTYANYPPTDADSITSAAVPGIVAGLKDQDATLTGWTTSITAGDILGFNVDANDNATRVTLALQITKT